MGKKRNAGFPLELRIKRDKEFDPSLLFGDGWKVLKQDEKSLRLNSVDLNKIIFKPTCSRSKNKTQSGRKLREIEKGIDIPLDAGIFMGIINKELYVPDSWKDGLHSKNLVMFFPGTTIVNPKNDYHLLYIEVGSRGGIRWGCDKLKFGKNPNHVFAVLPYAELLEV